MPIDQINKYQGLLDRTQKAIDEFGKLPLDDSDIEDFNTIMEFLVSSVGVLSMVLMNFEAKKETGTILYVEVQLINMDEFVSELEGVLDEIKA